MYNHFAIAVTMMLKMVSLAPLRWPEMILIGRYKFLETDPTAISRASISSVTGVLIGQRNLIETGASPPLSHIPTSTLVLSHLCRIEP